MRTIGRRYIGPVFNYTDLCEDCGTPWHATDLEIDNDNRRLCPNCRGGMTNMDIADAIAGNVASIEPIRGKVREDL